MSTFFSSTASLHAGLDPNGDTPKARIPRRLSPKPSFSRMTSAIDIRSARNSPSASHFGSNGSLQSTPEGIVPISHMSLPMPPLLTLPESIYIPQPPFAAPTSSPSGTSMAEALQKAPGGLIRRVSRGAQGIRSGFRRHGSNARRDKSTGPVIMRRRSDSRTAMDYSNIDISDYDLCPEEEEAIDDCGDSIQGLGITSSTQSITSIPDQNVIAPVRHTRLERGTALRKITKKDAKTINLRLDLQAARVFWDPARDSKCFYIDDLKEIRSGPEARHYREEFGYPVAYESRWFTIIYSDTMRDKGRIKAMHLIADDPELARHWTRALDDISRNRIDTMSTLTAHSEKAAKEVWRREMTRRFKGVEHPEHAEAMDFASVVELCHNLHINCSKEDFKHYFCKADSDKSGRLTQKQFLYFVRRLKKRKDINAIYKHMMSDVGHGIDQEAFFSFLRSQQGVNVDADRQYWTNVFERHTKAKVSQTENGEISRPRTMSFHGFQAFMTSPANSCYVPLSANLNLDRPLNEYFISSSHNTYLTGRQVVGESSTEAYITALQKGCRCLEIDCWDGKDDNPAVSHGRTFTTSISFRDTIKVINQYAFCESPYPLILSLEVHCNPSQQTRMSEIMKEEFGPQLVREPINDSEILPSPEELKGKILIKVKSAFDELDTQAVASRLAGRTRDRSVSSPLVRPTLLNDPFIPNSPLMPSPPQMSPPERSNYFWATPRTSAASTTATMPTPLLSSADDSDSPAATEAEDKNQKNRKASTSKIVKALGELGVYTKGQKFTSFKTPEAHTHNHVFSIGERTFEKLAKSGSPQKQALQEHNMRSLMRVYPHFRRITSTNFEPLRFWRRGVQMCALNWQTYDLGQQLNEAMFKAGDDQTGYVLKPAELRLEDPTPVIGHKYTPKKLVKFAVHLISAQQLPRPRTLSSEANINPYIEFEMYSAEDKDPNAGPNVVGEGGRDASTRSGYSGVGDIVRKRTNIITGNGYNPMWDERISVSLKTKFPSLVFVRWTVWNSRDGQNTERAPLATFTAKLSSLQQGYRHLPLMDSNGEQYLFSTLFCKIEKEEAVDVPPPSITDSGSSRRSSFDSSAPLQEATNQQTSRSFFRKIIGRQSSGSRKRNKDGTFERTFSEPKDAEYDFISRSSTFEKGSSMLEK